VRGNPYLPCIPSRSTRLEMSTTALACSPPLQWVCYACWWFVGRSHVGVEQALYCASSSVGCMQHVASATITSPRNHAVLTKKVFVSICIGCFYFH
jgi:hypothetical protein